MRIFNVELVKGLFGKRHCQKDKSLICGSGKIGHISGAMGTK